MGGGDQKVLDGPGRRWPWLLPRVRGVEGGEPRAQATWTGGNALAARATTVLVIGGLLTGPAALVAVASSGARAQAPAEVSAPNDVLRTDAAVASQRAQAWVRAWLSTPRGQEEDLREFWSGRVQLPAVARQVLATSVADVRELGDRRWSVQVAVVVREPAAEGELESETTSFFQVPVAVEPASEDSAPDVHGLVQVLALPAPVAGPQGPGAPARGYGDALDGDSPVASVVAPFLQALVTGQGDVTPYLQPGAHVAALATPAASELRVRSIAPAVRDRAVLEPEAPRDGDGVRVLAQVELVDPAGQRLASEYPLTLTARAGRWEVSSLDPAPVRPDDDAAPETTGPASPPPPTAESGD